MHPSSVGGVPWEMFKYEVYRIQTFASYPMTANKSPLHLAAVGFLYTGSKDDLVTCFFCFKSKNNWSLLDDVEEIHRAMSPECPMVTQTPCGNVSISRDPNCTANFFMVLATTANTYENSNTYAEDDESENLTSVWKSHETNISFGATASNPIEIIQYEGNMQTLLTSQTATSAQSDTAGEHGHAIATQSISFLSETPEVTEPINVSVEFLLSETRNSDVRESLLNSPQPYEPNLAYTNSLLEQGTSATAQSLTSGQIINNVNSSSGTNDHLNSTINQQSVAGTTFPRKPTYSDLGIVVERPKRPEFALKIKRLETFSSWPRDHHLTPEELSEAGFFYAGYGDCARCFYCGGGLRNWEDEDDVWVEHARWFPKCAYVRQRTGQTFVDEVQKLHLDFDQISLSMVFEKMGASNIRFIQDRDTECLRSDPAVKAVVELGYTENDVIEIARRMKEEVATLSADSLLEQLKKESSMRTTTSNSAQIVSSHDDDFNEIEKMNRLKEINNVLRQQIVCKICLVKEVETTFLPCGHLVSCSECSYAMKQCPLCRQCVKGVVKVFWA